MTDAEINHRNEERLEWLASAHQAGSFVIRFDTDLRAIVLEHGLASMSIPSEELFEFNGALVMMATMLRATGLITIL